MSLQKKFNNILLSSNDDKRMQSINLIETYAYGISKDLVSEKEKINWNNIIKQYKKWLTLMKIKEHNRSSPDIPDHQYRILITDGSGTAKTN